MHYHSRIEVLESRIAPAITIVNAHTAKYTDYDGDRVTISVSVGTLDASIFTVGTDGTHDRVQRINLSAGGFDGANITVTTVRGAGGDGLADIGWIDSTGHDLGMVRIVGDLGRIHAGDADSTTTGVKSLEVSSMGVRRTDTQQAGGNLESHIVGALGALTVRGSFDNAHLQVTGTDPSVTDDEYGKIGQITIGGSIIGGMFDHSGEIFCTGTAGPVKIRFDIVGGGGLESGVLSVKRLMQSVMIGGSVVGGAGESSGQVTNSYGIGLAVVKHSVIGGSGLGSGIVASGEEIKTLMVGGSVIGGSGDYSGRVGAGETGLAMVKIGHDVVGGTGVSSGGVGSSTRMDHLIVGGSVIGGSADDTGSIRFGDFQTISIGHDLIGGSVSGSQKASETGIIQGYAQTKAAVILIGGSIVAGVNGNGFLKSSGTIEISGNSGVSIVVKGSLIGRPQTGGTGASPVTISRGQNATFSQFDILRIAIGGNVQHAVIIGLTGDSRCGPVTVGGDWVASSIVMGGRNYGADGAPGGTGLNADNVNFGDGNDVFDPLGDSKPDVFARIASITIAGHVYGTSSFLNNTDHFGFVAERFGPIKIAGQVVNLTQLSRDIGSTGDVTIHRIKPPS